MKITPGRWILLLALATFMSVGCQKPNPGLPNASISPTIGSGSGPSTDLTTVFAGIYSGTCVHYYAHPSRFSETIPIATVTLTPIDSASLTLELYLNGVLSFQDVDTAFADQTLRLRSSTPDLTIDESAILKGDSLYFHSYRQYWKDLTFVGYDFAGKR